MYGHVRPSTPQSVWNSLVLIEHDLVKPPVAHPLPRDAPQQNRLPIRTPLCVWAKIDTGLRLRSNSHGTVSFLHKEPLRSTTKHTNIFEGWSSARCHLHTCQ